MTQNIGFFSAKGGQGVTTTAAVFALALAERSDASVLFVTDHDGFAVLGLPIAERGETNGLFITTKWEDAGEGYDIIVHDGLVKDGPSWTNYLVTRPCYLALRRAVSEVQIGYAGIIALMEPSRALSEKDVANALGNEVVATVSVHPVVARAIDAGLLPMRAMEQHKEVRLLALSHLRERQLLI